MSLPDKLLEELRARRIDVYAGGGEEKLQKRHEKGLLGARERILALFEPDTFQEIGAHVRHQAQHFGLDK